MTRYAKMAFTALFFGAVLIFVSGCKDVVMDVLVDRSGKRTTIVVGVNGSVEFPYDISTDGDDAVAVIDITFRHLPTGELLTHQTNLKMEETYDWENQEAPREIEIDTLKAVGVVVRVSYSEEEGGEKTIEDRAIVVLPFEVDSSGSVGEFSYQSTWQVIGQNNEL